MIRASEILDAAADTYRERNKVYGDNYLKVGQVMAALFPDGITLKTADDHNRFHIFALMIVKQTRYVLNWEKGGHQDSIHDNTVYSAMLEEIDTNIASREAPSLNDTLKEIFGAPGKENRMNPPFSPLGKDQVEPELPFPEINMTTLEGVKDISNLDFPNYTIDGKPPERLVPRYDAPAEYHGPVPFNPNNFNKDMP